MHIRQSVLVLYSIGSVVFIATLFGFADLISKSSPARFLSKDNSYIYKQEYYNVGIENGKSIKGLLPPEHYPAGEGSVITILVSKRPQDLADVQVALRSLAFLKGDEDPEHPAPVLIFNEGDLPANAIEDMIKSTNRPIGFPIIDFNSFPPGFNPDLEKNEFVVEGRSKWGYYQMIRFWITTVWKQPAIQRFDRVMRLDSDSCFKEVNDYLPNFMYDGLYYHSQYVGVEPEHGANFIQGMYDFVTNWMEKTKQPVEPRNTLLFHYVKATWESERTLPLFRTSFELSKRSFMQRGDIARFHEAVTEKDPFPLLRNRWGDAVLRFLLVSVFETNERIMTERPTGYFHKAGCSTEEVDEALRQLDGGIKSPAPVEVKVEFESENKAENAQVQNPPSGANIQNIPAMNADNNMNVAAPTQNLEVDSDPIEYGRIIENAI